MPVSNQVVFVETRVGRSNRNPAALKCWKRAPTPVRDSRRDGECSCQLSRSSACAECVARVVLEHCDARPGKEPPVEPLLNVEPY
jgi:hypothetical protein